MDLAADQKTMYFTQEGGEVKRVDVSTDTPLTDFSTDVEQAFALRIRSNGDVIVADGAEIEYLNGLGAETASYDIAGAGLWFALNLDPDGTSFWSATTDGLIARFDIATGTVLSSWTVSDTNGVWGLAILGEPTTGGPGPGPGVPEPGTLALVGLALLGLTKARRAAARRESR
ncbi:MAG: PEP-CTERM sorting domain-containing protein [Burkholderiales bacterium]|nr:PEP-CTERM sorting domain-containing protein [Burkholderiales bacterium]